MITSTKISKGSTSTLLQIDVFENGNWIDFGIYNEHGMAVDSEAEAKELIAARRSWGLFAGIVGAVPGALLFVGWVKAPGISFDVFGGIVVGGLFGAIGGLVGFLIGYGLEFVLQRKARLVQPAQTSTLLKSMTNASPVPALQPRRLLFTEAEGGADQAAAMSESTHEGHDESRLESEGHSQQRVPVLKYPAKNPIQIAEQPLGKYRDGPTDVGGWLLFFCFGLTILGPLITLWQMVRGWELAEPAFSSLPSIKAVLILENLGLSAIVIYGVVVGVIISGGSSQGRAIARRFLLVRLSMVFGMTVISLSILLMGDLPSGVTTLAKVGAVGGLLLEGVFFTIWWLYFEKSKRVHNIYGDE